MALVKRKVSNGIVVVLGRRYRLALPEPNEPAIVRSLEERRRVLEGKTVYVDDDGVCRSDDSKLGVRTTSRVRVYYPGRYDWYFNFMLWEDGDAASVPGAKPQKQHGRGGRRHRNAGKSTG